MVDLLFYEQTIWVCFAVLCVCHTYMYVRMYVCMHVHGGVGEK